MLARDRWREALVEARALVAEEPAEPRFGAALGEALFRAGKLAEIDLLLAPLAELPSAPAGALVTLGRLRDAEGRMEEAIGLMRRAVAAAPDDPAVHYWAATAVESRAEGIERLERYLELAGDDDPDRVASARSSLRLYRALAERVIWSHRTRPQRLELPIERVWDPTTGAIQAYVVPVRIGQRAKPVRLLLDSGSPGLFVIERVARKRPSESLSAGATFGGGGDQRHATRRVIFDEVAVGDLRFAGALATVAPGEADPVGRYHGYLGLGLFQGYGVMLDLAARKLALGPSEALPGGQPYWVVEGQWLVQARDTSGREGLFLLDTGATRSVLDRSFALGLEEATVGPAVGVRGFGGELRGAGSLSGVTLELQGLRGASGDLRVADLGLRNRMAGVEVSGFIGLDLLSRARLSIDTVRRRVRVEGSGD